MNNGKYLGKIFLAAFAAGPALLALGIWFGSLYMHCPQDAPTAKFFLSVAVGAAISVGVMTVFWAMTLLPSAKDLSPPWQASGLTAAVLAALVVLGGTFGSEEWTFSARALEPNPALWPLEHHGAEAALHLLNSDQISVRSLDSRLPYFTRALSETAPPY